MKLFRLQSSKDEDSLNTKLLTGDKENGEQDNKVYSNKCGKSWFKKEWKNPNFYCRGWMVTKSKWQ